MKTYVQFTTDLSYADSAILELEMPSKIGIKNLLASFKSNKVEPAKVMVDFIIFAQASIGDRVTRILSEQSVSTSTDVFTVETRVPNVVEFVYKKDDGKTDWRKIDIIEEDKFYIKGHDLNDNNNFKSFKKTNIVGGRMIKA
jgi:hypothetical protein